MSQKFTELALKRAKLWEELRLLGDPRTEERPEDNTILDVDSYKLCHQAMYKLLRCTGAFSYIEPRIAREQISFFGLQIWLKRFRPITHRDIKKAKKFFAKHIEGGDNLFPEADWKKVVDVYGGYPPLVIRAIPEGMIIDSKNALVTIECTDPQLAWMVAYFETSILRAVWYPTTVASRSRKVRNIIKEYLIKTSDLNVSDAVAYMFHDFGARGVSSKESSGIGGAAHLSTGALGTDNIVGVLFADEYYSSEMAGTSVFATEHSIMTMRGREGELQTVSELIEVNKGSILSIVSDGYDIYTLAEHFCTTLKQQVLDANITLVVRPDSGKASEVIVRLLNIFAKGYGYTTNSKGYKVLNVVKLLQGDGLSTPEDFENVLIAVMNAGFSVENIVFGQGGGLLQQVNRDTYGFAMKTCSAEIDGEWIDVFKEPITDPGKHSKKGRLTVVKNKAGKIATIRIDEMKVGHIEIMRTVWDTGELLIDHDFEEIRERSNL